MKLERTKHPYYCEPYESKRLEEFNSWEEFKKEGMAYDNDCNLVFRFDIKKYEREEGEEESDFFLTLHHALQRHGRELYHIIVRNLKEEDVPEIEAFLKEKKKYLLKHWEEING